MTKVSSGRKTATHNGVAVYEDQIETFCLTADLEVDAGNRATTATRGATGTTEITTGDQFDPQRVIAFEVRCGFGHAQRFQAALRQ